MKSTFVVGVVVAVVAVCTACTTMPGASSRFMVSVNALAESHEQESRKTYVLAPGNEGETADSLVFKEYAKYVHNLLLSSGYRPVGPAEAQLYIILQYGISEPQTSTSTGVVPIYNAYTGTVTYVPRTRSTTTYNRFASMAAFDPASLRTTGNPRMLWQTVAASSGESGDLRRVMPILVAAMKGYVATNTQRAVTFDLWETDVAVQEVTRPVDPAIYNSQSNVPGASDAAPKPGTTQFRAGLVSRPAIGIDVRETSSGELRISAVDQGPATEGLRVGDVIISIDGATPTSKLDIVRMILDSYPGATMTVMVRRNDSVLEVPITLSATETAQHAHLLTQAILEGNAVRLAMLVGEVDNLVASQEGAADKTGLEGWREAIKRQLLAQTESDWIRYFMGVTGLEIVDRQRIDAVLAEQEFSVSAMVESSARIGRIAGATHILLLELTRFPDPKAPQGFMDTVTERLVDVETARVVATVVKNNY